MILLKKYVLVSCKDYNFTVKDILSILMFIVLFSDAEFKSKIIF